MDFYCMAVESKIIPHPPGVWQILLKSLPLTLPADPPQGELLTETEDRRRLWLYSQSPYNITSLPHATHTQAHTPFLEYTDPCEEFPVWARARSCTGITSAAWRCCWVEQHNLSWSLGYKQIIAPSCVLLKNSTSLKYCWNIDRLLLFIYIFICIYLRIICYIYI